MALNKARSMYAPPEWLNVKFVTKVLSHCENSIEIKVKHLQVIPKTPKPNPFGSLIFQIIVEYEGENVKKTKSMFVKIMPEPKDCTKEFLGESYCFETEFGMYTDVIPKFEQTLREIGDSTVLSRRCLYHTSSPRKALVLEDLEPDGYSIPLDRNMTLTEVKTAYMKLAKWHAVSHKLSLENPSFFDNYRYNYFSIPDIVEKPFLTEGIDLFIELLDSVPTLKEYEPYFKAVRGNLVKKCIAISEEYRTNPQPDTIYVLCHGDYNYKNFILKNNAKTGELEDIRLVDLRVSYMGSIANDLIYATFTLLDPKLWEVNRDEIFYFYMTTFIETLKKLDFRGRLPKIAEIKEQIRKCKHLVLQFIATCRPLLNGWLNSSTDQEKLLYSADYRRQFYRSQKYIDELHMILPILLHWGFLED